MARSGMFNATQMEQMVKQYKTEKSLKKVAASFGVSVPTIAKYLRSEGVALQGRGRPRKLPLPEAGNTCGSAVPETEDAGIEPDAIDQIESEPMAIFRAN